MAVADGPEKLSNVEVIIEIARGTAFGAHAVISNMLAFVPPEMHEAARRDFQQHFLLTLADVFDEVTEAFTVPSGETKQ